MDPTKQGPAQPPSPPVHDPSPLGTCFRLINIREKGMSLPTCCIVSIMCVCTTATAAATKIKEKNFLRFFFRFRSNVNETLRLINLDLTVQGSDPSPSGGHVQLRYYCTGTHWDMFGRVQYETCAVGKRAVGIF